MRLKAQSSDLSEQETLIKHQLQERIGDYSMAEFNDGRISWKLSKSSTTFDAKRFKEEQPELHEAYLKEKPGSRRLLNPTRLILNL